MSREIILYIATSLDGYIAKENDDLQWLEETEGRGCWLFRHVSIHRYYYYGQENV